MHREKGAEPTVDRHPSIHQAAATLSSERLVLKAWSCSLFRGFALSKLFSCLFKKKKCFSVHLFLRERERERERETKCESWRSRERGRHRIRSRLQAPSCQHRARCGARTHKPWDHDLSWSRMLNWLSPPAFKHFFLMFIYFWEEERDRAWAGEGQREGETQNLKQVPGSELSAQSLTRGSNSQPARSWPEPKSDTTDWATQAPLAWCTFKSEMHLHNHLSGQVIDHFLISIHYSDFYYQISVLSVLKFM